MSLRAIEESVAQAGEQPVGMGPCQLDETEDRPRGDGGSGLVVMQGPERDLQGLRQERAAVDPVEVEPDLPNPIGQARLDRLPIRLL